MAFSEEIISFLDNGDIAKEILDIKTFQGFLGTGTRELSIENASRWRKFYVPDAILSHRLAPGVSILSDYVRNHIDIFSTDSWGVSRNKINGHESYDRVQTVRKTGGVVIAVLGGSTIQGVGAGSPRFTIPSLLEKIIEERYGVKAVCLNHGVVGWSSSDQLQLLLNGIEYRPDVCIFYDGWNCCWNFYSTALLSFYQDEGRKLDKPLGFRRGYSLRHLEHEDISDSALSLSLLLKRLVRLLGHSALRNFLRPLDLFYKCSGAFASKLIPIRPNDIYSKFRELKVDSALCEVVLEIAAKEYYRVHRLASAVCREKGFSFAHFFQPQLVNSKKIYTLEEETLLHRESCMPNPEIFSLFPQFIRRADLTDAIKDLSSVFDNEKKQVFLDGGHLNGYGNYIVADFIARELFSAGLLQPRADFS